MRHLIERATWYLAACLVIVIWRAFAPGLDGPFLYDDRANITLNEAIRADAITPASLTAAMSSGRAGPLGRPIAMATFAIDHARAGLDPGAFKRTNLLIHLLCGLLTARLSFLLTQRVFWREASSSNRLGLALLVAAVWLVHPLQLTNVLYVVQRMNSLSGLFTLAALVWYCASRFDLNGRIVPLSAGNAAFVLLMATLATLSKENGILTFAYIAAIETSARYALTPSVARNAYDRNFLLGIGACGLIAVGLLIAIHERLLAAYLNRDFTLQERLLTQPRVLLWYARQTVLPDIAEMGLIHDDWVKSASLLQPVTTVLAISAWLSLGTLAWLARYRCPLLIFGLLWYLLGHLMESTVWPLLMVFEHRNYLPLFGIVFAPLLLTARLLNHKPLLLKALLASALVAMLYEQTRERARVWSDEALWIQTQAHNHPNSPTAQYLKGDLFAQFSSYVKQEDRPKVIATADEAFRRAWELNPADISPLLARAYHASRLGLPTNKADLERAARQVQHGHIPIPTQNAVLTFCRQIRDGKIGYERDTHEQIFLSILSNPLLTEYIGTRLESCVRTLSMDAAIIPRTF